MAERDIRNKLESVDSHEWVTGYKDRNAGSTLVCTSLKQLGNRDPILDY